MHVYAQARPHWTFEHFLFLYHQHKLTALFFSTRSTSTAHICWRWAALPFADETFRFRCSARRSKHFSFLQGIGGFHITSSPPCWWTANKRSLISSFCLSTSICSFHHCYLCLPRFHENHLWQPKCNSRFIWKEIAWPHGLLERKNNNKVVSFSTSFERKS